MTEERRTQMIEDYLRGRMTDAEKADFEKQLEADPDISAEVERHRRADEVIRYANQMDLKTRLIAFDQQQNTSNPRKSFLRRLAIAASLLVLVAAGAYLFNNLTPDDDPRLSMSEIELAGEYFAPATTNELRSNSNPGIRTFSQQLSAADTLFLSGDYSEAAKTYEVLANASNPQSGKADWNMMLAKMAAGDDSFSSDLDRIAGDDTHLYHQKAIELREFLSAR